MWKIYSVDLLSTYLQKCRRRRRRRRLTHVENSMGFEFFRMYFFGYAVDDVAQHGVASTALKLGSPSVSKVCVKDNQHVRRTADRIHMPGTAVEVRQARLIRAPGRLLSLGTLYFALLYTQLLCGFCVPRPISADVGTLARSR